MSTEAVSIIERIGLEMFTGNRHMRPTRLWNYFGILEGITDRGWPSFDEGVFNLYKLQANLTEWPRDRNYFPILAQRPSVLFHYGNQVWQAQLSRLIPALSLGMNIHTESAVLRELHRIFQETMIPEWRRFVLQALIATCKKEANDMEMSYSDEEIVRSYVNQVKEMERRFEESQTPFTDE